MYLMLHTYFCVFLQLVYFLSSSEHASGNL